jgi:hypothetical protein
MGDLETFKPIHFGPFLKCG